MLHMVRRPKNCTESDKLIVAGLGARVSTSIENSAVFWPVEGWSHLEGARSVVHLDGNEVVYERVGPLLPMFTREGVLDCLLVCYR